MNLHDPIPAATESASRSPKVLESACFLCQLTVIVVPLPPRPELHPQPSPATINRPFDTAHSSPIPVERRNGRLNDLTPAAEVEVGGVVLADEGCVGVLGLGEVGAVVADAEVFVPGAVFGALAKYATSAARPNTPTGPIRNSTGRCSSSLTLTTAATVCRKQTYHAALVLYRGRCYCCRAMRASVQHCRLAGSSVGVCCHSPFSKRRRPPKTK